MVRSDTGGPKDAAERTVHVVDTGGRMGYMRQGEHPGVMPPLDEVKAAVKRVRGR